MKCACTLGSCAPATFSESAELSCACPSFRREKFTEPTRYGASRPRIYGVPKIHEDGNPLRPILSMTNAPQHSMWLTEVLKPVADKYKKNTIKDTFEFCEPVEEYSREHDWGTLFICSYDVTSFLTSILVAETINICMDSLYRDPHD